MGGRLARKAALAAASALLLVGSLPSAPAGAEPSWLTPRGLSAPGQDASEPQVALDSAGDAVAVWARSDGSHMIVQSSSRPAGGGWLAPQDLSAPGRDATEPQVSVDSAGNAVAAWARSSGLHTIVQSASRPAGGAWSEPVDLSAAGRSALEPRVAAEPGGGAMAIWRRYDGFNYVVQSATRPAGGAWGASVDLSDDSEESDEPQVALDSAGNAVAVWVHGSGSEKLVESASRPAGTSWGDAGGISAEGGEPREPRVAVNAAGDAVAAWARDEGSDSIAESASRPAGGPWQGPLGLSAPGGDASEPDVAIDPGGSAVAVWAHRAGSVTVVVQAASRPAGGSWEKPVDISPGGSTEAEAPRVASDPAGNAVAIWSRYAGGVPNVVEGALRPAGSGWQSTARVSEQGLGADEPQLALDPAGDGVAVWAIEEGADTIVQAAGHDRAAPQLASLSIPPAGTVRRPVSFSAAPFDNWSAIGPIGWSFGDGAVAAGATVAHAFAQPGVYQVGVTAADVLANSRGATGTIRIFRKPSAARNVRVRRGRALLRVRCPSPAGCAGVVRLVTGFRFKRRGRRFGRRLQIGRARFRIPGSRTTTVPVRLSRRARRLVRSRGRKGVRTQLTGAGVQHRLVILFEERGKVVRRRHARHHRPRR